MSKKTAAVKNAAAKETTKSGNFLKMWYLNEQERPRPTLHRFEVVDGVFELQIRKNKASDTTVLDMFYNGNKGRVKVTIGASTSKLGRVWVGAPELLEEMSENEVETH